MRVLPFVLFSPLAVAWIVLHRRAVRRVERDREHAAYLERLRLIEQMRVDLRAGKKVDPELAAELFADAVKEFVGAITAAFIAVGEVIQEAGRQIMKFGEAWQQH